MAGNVDHARRAFVVFDARHLHALRQGAAAQRGLLLLEQRLENHGLALVRLAVETARGVRVGDVLRGDFEPDALGVERGGGAFDAGEELDHGESLSGESSSGESVARRVGRRMAAKIRSAR